MHADPGPTLPPETLGPSLRRTSERARLGLLTIAGVAAAWAHLPLLRLPGRPGLAGPHDRFVFDSGATPPGLLVALAAILALRVLRRSAGSVSSPRDRLVAAVLLLAGVGMHAWSALVSAPDLLALSLWAGALGWVLWLRGRRGLRGLGWALAPLGFVVGFPGPLRNGLVDLLQQGMARAAEGLLAIAAVPIDRTGELLWSGSEQFGVIETCAGLRSAECLALIAIILVVFEERSGWRAWLVVLAAPLLMLAINLLRLVVSIVAPATAHDPSLHAGLAVAGLLAGVVALRALDAALAPAPPPASRPPGRGDGGSRGWPALAFCLWGLCLAALGGRLSSGEPARWPLLPLSSTSLGELGLAADVTSEPLVFDRLHLGTVALHQWFHRRYTDARGIPIDLWIAVGDPRPRGTSAWSPRLTRPQLGFETLERGPLAGPGAGEWRFGLEGTRSWLVFSRWEGRRGLAADSLRAFAGLDRAPWASPQPLLFVRIATPSEGSAGRAEAEQRLRAFWAGLEPRLAALRRAASALAGRPVSM